MKAIEKTYKKLQRCAMNLLSDMVDENLPIGFCVEIRKSHGLFNAYNLYDMDKCKRKRKDGVIPCAYQKSLSKIKEFLREIGGIRLNSRKPQEVWYVSLSMALITLSCQGNTVEDTLKTLGFKEKEKS